MNRSRLTDKEIQEVFDKLQINENNQSKVGIWQVHPIKKGTRLFTETH